VLVTEDRPGRLYVSLIELAPEWQGRGIGTAILRDLRAKAHAAPARLSCR
jgi:GNAT superfamily N-acetyltransferase